MSPRPVLALLVLALACSGCQRTLFATAPGAAGSCDARLVGRWQSLGDDGSQDGEVEARLTPDCRLHLVEHGAERVRTYPVLQLHTRGGWAWVDADAVGPGFDVEPGPVDRPGAAYVFAWSVDGDVATLTPPAHRRIAHRIVDGELEGAVHAEDHELAVRVDGDAAAIAALLEQPGTLDPERRLRFRRSTEAAR